jgi:hypothetical protein
MYDITAVIITAIIMFGVLGLVANFVDRVR